MSKSVRLADYLYAQIEELAVAEKRSLANMVKVLLEQALAIEAGGTRVFDVTGRVVDVIQADAQPRDIPARTIRQSAVDPFDRDVTPDFKPDPK